MLSKIFQIFFQKPKASEIISEYKIPAKISLTISKENGWFIITSPDLPGLVTQASSQKEMLEMVSDAVLTYFDVPQNIAKELSGKLIIENNLLQLDTAQLA